MKNSKKIKKLKKKAWAQIAERICAANDVLEFLHQDINTPLSFKEEVRKAQRSIEQVEDIAFERSLSKKEHHEVYGR